MSEENNDDDLNKLFKPQDYYTEKVFEDSPYRLSDGKAGFFFSYFPGIITDTIQQILQDVLCHKFHKLGEIYSPNDYLGTLGKDFGMLSYPSDTFETYRDRLSTKWNYVRTYGQQPKLQEVMESILTGTYTVRIDTKVQGIENEISKPKNAGINIQPYPNWTVNKTQFNVIFYLTEVLGSGEYSNLVSDEQFASIRENIRLIKPVNWACREIKFVYNPDNLYLWDGDINWDSVEATTPGWYDITDDSNFVLERHSYQQKIFNG